MEATNKYAVIMAGGIGSRFWPISKTSHPKQFLDILGTGKTLIQQTFERFEKICPKENIYIVTNESYRALVKEQLPGISDDQILGEPAAKNTAPCIAYACHKINQKNPDALIAVAPSDHIILNEQEFVIIDHDTKASHEKTGTIVLKKAKGFAPILLMDDIFEKLDEQRMAHLLGWVATSTDGPVFITDTHKARVADLLGRYVENYQLIEI